MSSVNKPINLYVYPNQAESKKFYVLQSKHINSTPKVVTKCTI